MCPLPAGSPHTILSTTRRRAHPACTPSVPGRTPARELRGVWARRGGSKPVARVCVQLCTRHSLYRTLKFHACATERVHGMHTRMEGCTGRGQRSQGRSALTRAPWGGRDPGLARFSLTGFPPSASRPVSPAETGVRPGGEGRVGVLTQGCAWSGLCFRKDASGRLVGERGGCLWHLRTCPSCHFPRATTPSHRPRWHLWGMGHFSFILSCITIVELIHSPGENKEIRENKG